MKIRVPNANNVIITRQSLSLLSNFNKFIFIHPLGSILLKLVYPVVDPLVQYEEVPQPKDDRNPLQSLHKKDA